MGSEDGSPDAWEYVRPPELAEFEEDRDRDRRDLAAAQWIRTDCGLKRDPKERLASFGLVYFLAAPEVNRVKIGFTDQVDCRRLQSLSMASPIPLTPVAYMRGTRAVEHQIHLLLAAYRLHGEWFDRSEKVEAFAREFATPWPAEREPRVSLGIPGSLAEALIGDIRLAVYFWGSRSRGREPIDWSKHLPDVQAWAAMVRDCMAARCPYVKRTAKRKEMPVRFYKSRP